MRLTRYTDYALRVLMYLGTRHSATIPDIAARYNISRNHLLKVVHGLAQRKFIVTQRGKGGGLTLARPPREISVGDVVRRMEEDLALVECLGNNPGACLVTPCCALTSAFVEARENFLRTLDRYTLADLLTPGVQNLLTLTVPPPAVLVRRRKKSMLRRKGH